MEKSRKFTIMQLRVSLPKKILFTALIMFALILLVYFCKIPNPNMILIAGLVLCSALFGFGGGVVASAIMLGYTLYFFSTDHCFTQFTTENLQKVLVSLIGIAADMLLVCALKQAEIQAFDEVDDLTERLHRENDKLQHLSLTDALTGIRNRLALRQDYDTYQGHEVVVMMLDLNEFKSINDTRGHEEGDRILKETAALLADTFQEAHSYRYGGDEFLVIVPDISLSAFREKLENMETRRPVLDASSNVEFAVGIAHARLEHPAMLRKLIAEADEKMYAAKRDKKRSSAFRQDAQEVRTEVSEYTVEEMKTYLAEMSEKYALARVVDPVECRILEFREDGKISMNERCYGIWNAEQKCINCSSATACRTGCHQEKAEHFKDDVYFIQSSPVTLKLPDGSDYSAVVELVNVEKESKRAANDREAENIGARADHYLAHHDSLTNVLNADAFYEVAREVLKHNADAPRMMITSNIMNFRLINTLFGVRKGNEVLVKTASLLREISEGAGGLCGRLGSDQFALLIPKRLYREETLQDTAQILAEEFSSGIYTFCIHFGVYEIDDPSIPVSVMCGRSNSALRTIREDITQTVACFDHRMLERILLEHKIIAGFEDALRDGEFRMYLQPLVGKDGSVVGGEALVRWVKPDGSVVMPGDFIEVLENAGLIHRLDQYMWELAVKQLQCWKGTDKGNLTISVNMSAKDFYSMDVYRVLTDLVDKYEVNSHLLRLEITETTLLAEPEQSDAIVARLRQKGFLVEIDDFGKGYSSLSLLKNIKADVLKIDMSFLREIRDRERSRVILQSVIGMADSLGMDVITEGVETEQQFRILAEMGCRHFQGYYFSRPVPVAEFEERAVNRND